MKKIILSVIMLSVLIFGIGAVSAAEYEISFLHEDSFSNVDDTSGFSNDDSMSLLDTDVLSLISGDAKVKAIIETEGTAMLSHRGTRGLGIYGDENDEVDDYERIVIKFTEQPAIVKYLETRSLFDEGAAPEEGDVKFYLNGIKIGEDHMIATQTSGFGQWSENYNIEVDKIVFYIKKNQPYTQYSEFAVAKLIVEIDKEAPGISIENSEPMYPTCTDEVKVCATITDASDITSVTLTCSSDTTSVTKHNLAEVNGKYCALFSASSMEAADAVDVDCSFTAMDEFENSGSSDATPMFTYDCMNPVAIITGDLTCNEGTTVTLSGASSHDTVDTDLDYSWSWDGNTATTEEITVECVDDGLIDVILTVEDNIARTDSTTESVKIFNVNPTAYIDGETAADEGASVTLTASEKDPGILDTHTFAWDLDNDGSFDDATGAIASVHCIDEELITVHVEVTDDDLGIGTETHEVQCMNVKPTVNAGGPYSCDEGENVTLIGSAIDPGINDVLTYVWTIEGDEYPGESILYTCLDGDDTITAELEVFDETEYNSSYAIINIANKVPWDLSIAVQDTPAVVGEEICFTGTASDVDADEPLTNFDWSYDGDALDNANCHTFDERGIYTVTMTVTDKDGGSNTMDTTVEVFDYSIGLNEGWNLISIPLVPEEDDTSVEAVFKSLEGYVLKVWSYTWDGTEKNVWDYTEYDEVNGWSNPDFEIIPGYGYYVLMKDVPGTIMPVSIQVQSPPQVEEEEFDYELFLNGEYSYEIGAPVTNDTLPVFGLPPSVTLATDSWNLVGIFGLMEKRVDYAFKSLTLPLEVLDYYDIIYNEYGENLMRDRYIYSKDGYWLSVKLIPGEDSIEYKANYKEYEVECRYGC